MLEPQLLHPIASRSQDVGHAKRSEASKTILLVDDEPAVRRVVRLYLESSGYRVLEAADGAEALALFGELDEPVDMVLTDVAMPRMSGVELIKELRRRVPRLEALLVTGYPRGMPDLDLGDPGVDTLPKPFTRAALLDRVRAVLDD